MPFSPIGPPLISIHTSSLASSGFREKDSLLCEEGLLSSRRGKFCSIAKTFPYQDQEFPLSMAHDHLEKPQTFLYVKSALTISITETSSF